ncbi:hypothetical protein [Sphingomonas sp. PR090111-T3T-6A]|uniref:hypothetical protein n=1 Tax=Sphingomonas sp. PR090111-T3T-6A TaxID=685778 RepID=UPI0003815E7E|nr:hypothetical protein [Sphingomonas sp. PR090111-T3T-6A]
MRHERFPSASVHPAWCKCCHPETRSLGQRFADAAEPGDFMALKVGLWLGIALCLFVGIADNWSSIVAFVGGAL